MVTSTPTLNQLIQKTHEYLELISSFNGSQINEKNALLGSFDGSNCFDAIFNNSNSWRQKAELMDQNSMEVPILLAEKVLETLIYGQEAIQLLINHTVEFSKYSPNTFNSYGKFLSVMMKQVLRCERELTINTHNRTLPHQDEWFRDSFGYSTYPWKMDEMYRYMRDNLLISNFGSYLDSGKLNIIGNVGNFLASFNNGSEITLEGDCGWRTCYGMEKGTVLIKEKTSHGLGTYARGGTISVENEIKSIGSDYTPHNPLTIYEKNVLIPKKTVDELLNT